MKTFLLFLAIVLVGGTSARSPPLADLHHVPGVSASHQFDVNWGFTDEVKKEIWDRYTVRDAEPPQIEHPNLNGANSPTTVVGTTLKTINDRKVYGFLGIDYGEAPVGELRFQKTQEAGVYWEGSTLMATNLGNKCPQKAMLGNVLSGDEDCLNLNVYTPYLPTELPGGKLLPVMMFIHGGAFTSGDSSLYLPTKLLDHDVILVVIHYRLGTLGFFSLDNDDAPGNAGLWDQIEAMKWIQDNIEGFGGDSERVTIFGESAGSASVNYHLILPESAGLFHGVIGESGSALEHWSHDSDPVSSARLVGEFNTCPTENLNELYDCMVKKDVHDLVFNLNAVVGYDRRNGGMGFRGAAPVTQGPNVTERLMEKQPEDYFTDGDVANVPLMIGANKHEGTYVLTIMYLEYLVANNLSTDEEYMRNDMIDDFLNAFGVTDKTHGIAESLQDSFIGGRDLADLNNSSPGLVDMAGVFFLKAGGWETAKLHAKHTDKPKTFYYSFDFESDDTMFRWLFMGATNLPFRPGVTHSDELMYIFPLPAVLEGQQITVKDRMVRMWTNFAIHGDPTPDADEDSWKKLKIPKWKPLTPDDHNYMLIKDECTLEQEYPNRWHITLDESQGPVTTSITPNVTEGPSWGAYNSVEKERESYMISMIVFVITTVCFGGICGYFYFRKR
ncbi:juvenile hormone esterase-like isoform X2 [Panulirus ornatus]